MKHLTIDGCTVTITGANEARLAKLIRKLEAKPVRRWRVKARHRSEGIQLDVEGQGMTRRSAVPEALRVWNATLPWANNATIPYPIRVWDAVELREV